jgi:hypothetical protein
VQAINIFLRRDFIEESVLINVRRKGHLKKNATDLLILLHTPDEVMKPLLTEIFIILAS